MQHTLLYGTNYLNSLFSIRWSRAFSLSKFEFGALNETINGLGPKDLTVALRVLQYGLRSNLSLEWQKSKISSSETFFGKQRSKMNKTTENCDFHQFPVKFHFGIFSQKNLIATKVSFFKFQRKSFAIYYSFPPLYAK